MTKLMNKWMSRSGFVAVVAAASMLALTGCDDGGGGGGGDSIVGSWALDAGKTVTGNPVSWYKFNDDGTFAQYNDAGFTSKHLGGTYSKQGDIYTGPFVNPGVGDGRIEATINEAGVLSMDFIEYWHTPNKHVPFTGTKL